MNQFDSGGTINGQASYIDPNTIVEGALRTSRDLRVDGAFSGTIICDGVLLVAEGANVDAEIDAATIVVAGHMSGTIRCRGRLEIRSTGSVTGDVSTGALVILEGARYEGRIEMEVGADTASPVNDGEQPEEEDADDDGGESEYSFLRRFAPDEEEDESVEDES